MMKQSAPDMNKRTKRNFTLIELLVVMLLMGVLMTLMLPAFNRMISGNKVDQIASNLKLGLEQAQTQAIGNRRYVALILPHNNQVWSDASVRNYCFGGFRLAFVTPNGTNWEFDEWIPENTWKNSPNGAMLLKIDTATPPATGTALARNDITTALNTALEGNNRLESISNYPPENNPSGSTTRSNCAIIFTPYGGVESSDDLYLYIVEAISDGGNGILFPTRDSQNRPTNYLILSLNQFSGKVDFR
ncbi:pilus assembly FimT family protein [Victivallis vadensis]|uniref:pilus assembly FimT family protein n=1 Tax=Victivallis vadensis TaxID=172901 RepID=UPI0023F98CF6|nr:type II secretion system protein [Victivallis vadensis]